MDGDGSCDRETATWLAHTYGYGRDRLHRMHDELAGGGDLTTDPVAWDNTTAALDWMAGQWMSRHMQHEQPITERHREMLRRVAALGREALAGRQRSPELRPLIEECLIAFYGPRWSRIPDWPSTLALSEAFGRSARDERPEAKRPLQ